MYLPVCAVRLLLCLIWCLVFLYRKDFTIQFNSENYTGVFHLLQSTCLSMAKISHSIYQKKVDGAKQRTLHLYRNFVYSRFMWGECVVISECVYLQHTAPRVTLNFQIIELSNFSGCIIGSGGTYECYKHANNLLVFCHPHVAVMSRSQTYHIYLKKSASVTFPL